jgi:hypothetical protein
MGLLLFDAFEEPVAPDPVAAFVRARTGRVICHGYGGRRFDTKDLDEVDWINFDFSRSLAAVDDSIADIDVALDEGDDSLILDLSAHANGIVCARWNGGLASTHYTVRCRVTTNDGRTWDLSGSVFVSAH